MPGPPNKRRRRDGRVSARRSIQNPVAGKEFNYILQLTEEDIRLLKQYKDVLAQGAAGFAETAYNYLFDNPDIADVMYAYERQGGNLGQLVRRQLEHLLGLLHGDVNQESTEHIEALGREHFKWGMKTLWSLGAYRLYLDHLHQLVASDPQIEPQHRVDLDSALTKMVFRGLGVSNEAYWRALVEGLTEQRDELDSENSLAGEILGNIPQMLWTVNIEINRITYASPGTRDFCGETLESPIPCFHRIHASDRERLLTAWEQVIDGRTVQLEVQLAAGEGGDRWFRIAHYPVANRRGRVLRVHCMMEDVTDLHVDRERLEQLATRDAVTGLANRALWYDRLSSALAVARRNPGSSVAVMLLDINQFKMYNDSLGHEAGDALLRQIAERLAKVLRDTDALARLGGDEFGIVLPMVQNAEKATERIAKEVTNCLSAPFSHEGRELCVSSAIGIALFPQHGNDTHTLVSHADSAMYRAKWNSMSYLYYQSETSESATEHLQFSGQLHGALERNEFELLYQPKVDLASGRAYGAEALLRWQHPQEGLVLPHRFIPLAEQLGMITPITDWVLETALQQSRKWSQDNRPLQVSVNISARSFQSAGLVGRIEKALRNTGVDGSNLEVEVTESTLMSDLDAGIVILEQLAALGVSIAIDDFGTGRFSMSSLKHLPVNTLKIDNSFLTDLSANPDDAAIVRSIIELGRSLGCKVVAEGVEHEKVSKQLLALGCDLGQGFYISKPLSQGGFNDWLAG